MSDYNPADWRSTEQIADAIYARHHYRVPAAGRGTAILVNDTNKSVHELPMVGEHRDFTKAWYLEILRRLDAGEKPPQTQESQHYPADAYRRWAR